MLLIIIDENQGGFVQGRGTFSNAIVVLELLDLLRLRDPRLGCEVKALALKLDMMKTYDQVN